MTHSLLSHSKNEAIKHGFHFVKLANDERFVVKLETGFSHLLLLLAKLTRNGAVA